MNKDELDLLVYKNKKFRIKLVELFIGLSEYCEASGNGKSPAPKGMWKNVSALYSVVKKEIENEKEKTE